MITDNRWADLDLSMLTLITSFVHKSNVYVDINSRNTEFSVMFTTYHPQDAITAAPRTLSIPKPSRRDSTNDSRNTADTRQPQQHP